jgi:hypothetical protein
VVHLINHFHDHDKGDQHGIGKAVFLEQLVHFQYHFSKRLRGQNKAAGAEIKMGM